MADQTDVNAAPARDEIPLQAIVQMGFAMLVMVGLMGLLHWYIGSRLIGSAGYSAPVTQGLWVALWSGFAIMFSGFLASRLLSKKLAAPLQWLGFAWMGTFAVLLSGTALSDALLLGVRLVSEVTPETPLLRSQIVLGIAIPALLWGAWVARRPEVKRVEIKVPNLGAEFDGYRIVQLSDVHIGETLGLGFATWLTGQVNQLQPDAIALTGDLVDGSVTRIRDQVAPFAGLKSRDGTFFVTGNHEYYHGGSAWEAEWARMGATVLHNEHRVVQRGSSQLVFGGVTDLQGGRFSEHHQPDTARAFAGAPAAPRVLLAHQPLFARGAVNHGVSLMLSGHTHGGQIFPFMFFVKLQQPVVSGLRTIHGVLTYTSNGTGYWGPPFRIGPRGETTEITLRVG